VRLIHARPASLRLRRLLRGLELRVAERAGLVQRGEPLELVGRARRGRLRHGRLRELLERLAAQGDDSKLARAVGSDRKGRISIALYVAAIPLAFVQPLISDALFVIVALVWLVPDRRIERVAGL